MDTHITVNVVEPGSNIVVPNTGTMTMDSSIIEAGAIGIGIVVAILTIIAAIVAVINKKKNHKVLQKNKAFKVGMRRGALLGTVLLFALCGAFGFAATRLTEEGEVFAAEQQRVLEQQAGWSIQPVFDNTISVSVSDVTMDVEVDKEAVFAYAKGEIKVTSPTLGGYSLYMYTEQPDLVNEKTGDKIKMLSVPQKSGDAAEAEELGQKLTDNTWGVTPEKPTAKGNESAIWHGLPTSLEDAYLINYTESATEANDTTTGYFGTYVTPELPYGTYKGLVVNYVAIANYVEPDVVFMYSGDNIYFDEAKEQTRNAVGFVNTCPQGAKSESSVECGWVKADGKYKDPIMDGNQTLEHDSWFIPSSNTFVARSEEDLLEYLNDYMPSSDQTINVFGAVVDYFTITYDANGGKFVKECRVKVDESIAKSGVINDSDCQEEELTSVTRNYGINNEDYSYNYFGLGCHNGLKEKGEIKKAGLSPDLYFYCSYYHDNDLVLLGWSEDPAATIPTYYDGDSIPTSQLMKGMNIKLYAVWGQQTPSLLETSDDEDSPSE